MPGRIQSVERAVAVLRTLGTAPHDLALQEIADSLDLAKATTHGLVATLRHVGLVEQDRVTGRYRAVPMEEALPRGGIDAHELRSQAMNWADSLASATGEAVLLGVPGEAHVDVVHHVLRPDGSPQRMMFGDRLPAHATALGKVLLAATGWMDRRTRQLPLEGYTSRTLLDRGRLAHEVAEVRRTGYAVEVGEWVPDVAGVAAPVRAFGGLGVGAIGVVGDLHRICPDGRVPRADLVERVLAAGRSVSAQLEQPR